MKVFAVLLVALVASACLVQVKASPFGSLFGGNDDEEKKEEHKEEEEG